MSSDGILSVIPQIFYDIIGRIIPGVTLLFLLTFSFYGQKSFVYLKKFLNMPAKSFPPTLIFFILLFIFSYSLSIFFWGHCKLYNFLINKISKKGKPNDFKNNNDEKDFSLKYDFIKNKDFSAGSRITKLKAEDHMLKNFIVGFVYCFIINAGVILYNYTYNIETQDLFFRIIFFVILFIAIFCFIATRKHINKRMNLAIENYSKIFGFKQFLKSIDNEM